MGKSQALLRDIFPAWESLKLVILAFSQFGIFSCGFAGRCPSLGKLPESVRGIIPSWDGSLQIGVG
ncbi:hypothetical protein ACFFUE_05865 [Bergeyella porcorum]|uniref:hypothetical protein n=1 Tax=Bergeyella porcorum TaxID=1735111 RepID=UPI0035EBB305